MEVVLSLQASARRGVEVKGSGKGAGDGASHAKKNQGNQGLVEVATGRELKGCTSASRVSSGVFASPA